MRGSSGHIVIGRLGRPHGVTGTLHARATGPTLATLAVGETVWVRAGGADADAVPHVVAERAGPPDRPRIAFAGVDTRDAAAALTGADLLVPAERRAPLDEPDTFYVADLVGCTVMLGDRELGPVREVHAAPANDALEVDTPAGAVLIPFTADAVVDIAPAERRITVRPDLLD